MVEIKTFEERKEELIKKGLEHGFITFEELAESLKGLEIDSDTLDELYNAFVETDIKVVSQTDIDNKDSEKEKIIEEDKPIILDDEEITKDVNINDPVRMYLKEIGKISLLTLEEESDDCGCGCGHHECSHDEECECGDECHCHDDIEF